MSGEHGIWSGERRSELHGINHFCDRSLTSSVEKSIREAGLQVIPKDEPVDLLEGGLGSRDLLHQVHAVAPVFDHPDDPVEVAPNGAKARKRFALELRQHRCLLFPRAILAICIPPQGGWDEQFYVSFVATFKGLPLG